MHPGLLIQGMDASTMIPLLRHLSSCSARVILPHFTEPGLRIEWKADATPVTVADLKAEEVLRVAIEREFPEHGIIGEEFPSLRPDAEFTWVLDPIDGTRSFTAGCPLFGTIIALRRWGKPLWGAIHLPVLDRLYVGNNDEAWCGERRIRIRETSQLNACLLLTTDPKSPFFEGRLNGWESLVAQTGLYRSWGDCFGYTLVAGGTADIMVDPKLNLWDLAGVLPIVRGAGCLATDWSGGAAEEADSLVVAHPRFHAQVLAILGGHSRDRVRL